MGLSMHAKWGLIEVPLTEAEKREMSALMLEGVERWEAMEQVVDTWNRGLTSFYDNPDFPGRIAPTEGGKLYTVDGSCEVYAASYGGWSRFRDWLCGELGLPTDSETRWMETAEDQPAYHLWCFSDCEGFIGADACRRILRDLESTRPDLVEQGLALVEQHEQAEAKGWEVPDHEWNVLVLGQLVTGLREIAKAGSGGLDFH